MVSKKQYGGSYFGGSTLTDWTWLGKGGGPGGRRKRSKTKDKKSLADQSAGELTKSMAQQRAEREHAERFGAMSSQTGFRLIRPTRKQ